MTDLHLPKALWESLTTLAQSRPRFSAKGFSKRRKASLVPLSYLMAASHLHPSSLPKGLNLQDQVEALSPLLQRRLAIVSIEQDGRVHLVSSPSVKDFGSRLSLIVLVKDRDGQWRWVMWETKATLSLSDLLGAECTSSTTPIISAIKMKL